ncbi:Csu type fimbrial protein [Solimonas variicoloris]|uniref:Csu type fimbrial protein n=1 Tax=Solimonas variicoloris TaxID=254408 RepID=UPI00036494A4|nr:spore coat U domain-containing protein [Solimonas variicoloris]
MKLRTCLLAIPLCLACRPALALLESCSASTSAVSFGNYSPFSSVDLDTTGTVTVTCTALLSIAVNYTIKLGPGVSGSFNPRRLSTGPYTLNYNLYTNSTRTSVWGDGTGSTQTVSDGYALGLLIVTRNYTVYGRLPARQNAASGVYSDTVVVTVEY